jgi:PAS domain-containing protein
MELVDWAKAFPGAVTVTDAGLRIIYMNEKAKATFAAEGGERLIGGDLLACHNQRSRDIIASLLAEGGTNAYTIEKKGQRKLIYQSAWRDEKGEVAGLVELSLVLPEGMPHYVRG